MATKLLRNVNGGVYLLISLELKNGKGVDGMTIRVLCCCLILATVLGVQVAKADSIENLVFTGTATCEPGFTYQECVGGTVGPVAGTYTLDVTSQTIVGPWSFTTPFASFSSADAGASAVVYDNLIQAGTSYDDVEFMEETPTFNEVIFFGFTGSGALTELGSISPTPPLATVLLTGLCQNVPGTSPAGCEPDVNITGSTALAQKAPVPEPSCLVLLGTGLIVGLGRRLRRMW